MNYRKIGDVIQLVDERNKDLSITELVGLTINKKFIPSVANTIGTDMSNYKIIKRNQFACSTMQVRRDKKMPVALLKDIEVAIISQAYPVFEVIDQKEIVPEYLMLWFSRSEFDREACFHAVGGVRGSLEWEDFCNMELPVPSIEKQREIVAQYQAVENKIKVNEQICEKLEATAQALYKHWFVDFEFPFVTSSGVEMPYKSSGGKMIFNEELEMEIPEGWEFDSFTKLCKIGGGGTPKTDVDEYWVNGDIPFYSPGDKSESFYSIKTEKFITDLGLKKCSSKLYPIDTVFVTARGATTGGLTLAGIPMAMNQTCYAILSEISKPIFTYYQTKSIIDSIKSQAVGATFEAVVTKNFEESRIITPNIIIIERFELILQPLFKSILNISFQNQKLAQLQSLLLSRLARMEEI